MWCIQYAMCVFEGSHRCAQYRCNSSRYVTKPREEERREREEKREREERERKRERRRERERERERTLCLESRVLQLDDSATRRKQHGRGSPTPRENQSEILRGVTTCFTILNHAVATSSFPIVQ